MSVSCDKDGVDSSDNYITIQKDRYALVHGFYDDYGNSGSEYNMELYLSNLSFAELDRCNGACDAIVVVLDIYGSQSITIPQTYKIGEYQGNYAGVYIEQGTKSGFEKEINLISGTVTVEGKSMNSLKVTINGVDDEGNAVGGSFRGTFKNLKEY